jgi:hypothetical protein
MQLLTVLVRDRIQILRNVVLWSGGMAFHTTELIVDLHRQIHDTCPPFFSLNFNISLPISIQIYMSRNYFICNFLYLQTKYFYCSRYVFIDLQIIAM